MLEETGPDFQTAIHQTGKVNNFISTVTNRNVTKLKKITKQNKKNS